MRQQVQWQGGLGRDHGKVYEITEVSPFRSFAWGMKFAHALGDNIPENYSASIDGVALWISEAGIANVIKANPAEILPLLDELLTCVRYKSSPDSASSFAIADDDRGYIEERSTLIDLYLEIFRLHTAF